MSDPLTEVRFWMQVIADSERTIICSPENESRIKSWIDARNCGGILKVQVETFVPDDQIFVMDHNAISASMRQLFAGPVRLWPLRDRRDGYKEHWGSDD